MVGLRASTPGTPVTKEDLSWALSAVRSRSFSGPYAGAACITAPCGCFEGQPSAICITAPLWVPTRVYI